MTDARLGRCGKLASATAAAVVLAALLALPCANATAAAAPFGWVGAVAVSPSTGRVLLGIGDKLVRLSDEFNVDSSNGLCAELRVLLGADCL